MPQMPARYAHNFSVCGPRDSAPLCASLPEHFTLIQRGESGPTTANVNFRFQIAAVKGHRSLTNLQEQAWQWSEAA
jgi:hypothetical protein